MNKEVDDKISNNQYDLEERTALFGENVIAFCRLLPKDEMVRPLIKQLIRSSTSIGANYMEANGASSKRDFRNKIHICKKEAQESKHWLRMIVASCPSKKEESQELNKECQEFVLIFHKITQTLRDGKNEASPK